MTMQACYQDLPILQALCSSVHGSSGPVSINLRDAGALTALPLLSSIEPASEKSGLAAVRQWLQCWACAWGPCSR